MTVITLFFNPNLVHRIVRVFFHNPGVIMDLEALSHHFIDVFFNGTHFNGASSVYVGHDIYTMLNFDGAPCNQEKYHRAILFVRPVFIFLTFKIDFLMILYVWDSSNPD